MNCAYCNDPINHPDYAFRRVVGWERRGKGASRKGGSDIVLREHRDEWACVACVDRLKLGLSVSQGSLL